MGFTNFYSVFLIWPCASIRNNFFICWSKSFFLFFFKFVYLVFCLVIAVGYTHWIVFKQQHKTTKTTEDHTFLEFPSVVYPTVVVSAPVVWVLALFLRATDSPRTEPVSLSTLPHLNRYSCNVSTNIDLY